MLKMFGKKLDRNIKGFTLIELLIVVAIIGILAAVGATVIPGLLGSAKENTVKSNHKNSVKFAQSQFMKCTLGESELVYNVHTGATITMPCSKGPQQHTTGIYEHLNAEGFMNPYTNYFAGQSGTATSTPDLGYTSVFCETISVDPSIVSSSGQCIIKTQWKKGKVLSSIVTKE